jgi:hypothetical protein
MGILLFLTGLLAAGSGAVKLLRGGRGANEGRSFAVVEVGVGAAVILGSGMGLARIRPLAWAAVATAAVAITASSVAHFRAGLRDQARRAASEEARFRLFLGRPDASRRGPR